MDHILPTPTPVALNDTIVTITVDLLLVFIAQQLAIPYTAKHSKGKTFEVQMVGIEMITV